MARLIGFLNILLITSICFLNGCGGGALRSIKTQTSAPTSNNLQQANHYVKLAKKNTSMSYVYKLKAADYFIKSNYIETAEQLISSIPAAIPVGSAEDCYSHILLAKIA